MFKKISYVFLILLFVIGIGFRIAHAQDVVPQESISSFSSHITVNTDNSIDVIETIIYNSGPNSRHGIYRDINLLSSEGRKMSIENINVVDAVGNPYPYKLTYSTNSVDLKIGDPDSTFTGEKTYVITYHATRAVAQLENVDEIYWNVTGNGWAMPIYKAYAFVVLPKGTQMTQSSCYFGPRGTTSQCQPASLGKDSSYNFSTPSTLNPNEGLTVALGFPKGVVTPYVPGEGMPRPFDAYKTWLIASILPLLTLIFSLRYWYKNGRDPKGTGVIVAQYDVPDNLTPMEVAGIVKEKVSATQISAEIIYLATKGYLKITQVENKTLGIFKSTDYVLTKLKNTDPSDLSGADKNLMTSLFGENNEATLSDLQETFYKNIKSIVSTTLDELVTKGYYKNLGKMKNSSNSISFIIVISVWASGFFGGMLGIFVLKGNPLPWILGIFFSIIIYVIIRHFSPSKTEKGVATKEYLLGLKEYLQIAEKDRLNFHNAPEKKPEIFEALLPYAMVLGVVGIWAKEFEGIYTTPPSWYSGPYGNNNVFSAIAFTHSINNFSSFANSSLGAAPGGSGGGGFSGGGGGGGGGGSW